MQKNYATHEEIIYFITRKHICCEPTLIIASVVKGVAIGTSIHFPVHKTKSRFKIQYFTLDHH